MRASPPLALNETPRLPVGRFDPETMLENESRKRLWGDVDFFYERDYLRQREMKSALHSPGMLDEFDCFDATRVSPVDVSKIRSRHPIHRRSYLDFKLRLSDHLVADHGDRVEYANSIEARYPFLDARLRTMYSQDAIYCKHDA